MHHNTHWSCYSEITFVYLINTRPTQLRSKPIECYLCLVVYGGHPPMIIPWLIPRFMSAFVYPVNVCECFTCFCRCFGKCKPARVIKKVLLVS